MELCSVSCHLLGILHFTFGGMAPNTVRSVSGDVWADMPRASTPKTTSLSRTPGQMPVYDD